MFKEITKWRHYFWNLSIRGRIIRIGYHQGVVKGPVLPERVSREKQETKIGKVKQRRSLNLFGSTPSFRRYKLVKESESLQRLKIVGPHIPHQSVSFWIPDSSSVRVRVRLSIHLLSPTSWTGRFSCLLWIEKVRVKDKTYEWGSVRWEYKSWSWGIYMPHIHWVALKNRLFFMNQ